MSEVLHRLATKEAVDALTEAVEALPNATQEAADNANDAADRVDDVLETLAEVSPARTVLDSSEYDRKLVNVDISVFTSVLSTNWDDMPEGITAGTFFNFVYDQFNHATQFIVSYPTMKLYSRTVDYSEGTVFGGWMEYENEQSAQLDVKYITPSASDYDNLLSKLDKPGYLVIGPNPAWEDLPTSSFTGVVANYPYTSTTEMQFAYQYGINPVTYMRYVNQSTGEVYSDWVQTDGTFSPHMRGISTTDYDDLLANVDIPVKCAVSNLSIWDDAPSSGAGIFYNTPYYAGTFLQIVIMYPSLVPYLRIVQNKAVVVDWTKPNSAGNHSVYYALGDSITSGSYSNDQGQGIVATDAAWSYPRRIEQKYGCEVHNIGVPGAAITQYATQAALVESDATLVTITGGANDYGGSKPLGTHESTKDYNTICGSIRSIVESIAAVAPNARIVLLSPIPMKTGTASTKWSINQAGAAGFTYAQLADAMKDIAEDYNIEFIDGTNNGPVSMLNIGSVLKDNIHPTKEFYETISNWLGSRLY